ncbi:MAG TPA: SPFH domain-containing protein [Dyella sp.]|nr:SPFH domain-containing protein [Dyella sp.]
MLALTFALVVASAGLAASAVRHVPAGQVHSLYRRGRPLRLLQPGTHWVLPGLDRIGHRIDLAGQVLRFEQAQVDNHELRGTVYWQVLEPERADAVIDDAAQLIRRSALDALLGEPAAATADRRDLGTRIKQAINGVLRERGMLVTRVELEIA